MDIKKALLEIVDSKTYGRHAYLMVEKLIISMLQNHLQEQGKKITFDDERRYVIPDAVLPDGIDDIEGRIAVEIKMYRNSHMSLKYIYDTIGRYSMRSNDFDKLLFIAVSEIPQNIKKRIKMENERLNFEVIIWDINDLVNLFEKNEVLFEETYNNVNTILLKETIAEALMREEKASRDKRENYIKQLHDEYESDNVVLFLGAGASRDANIATWDVLISELFVALIDKQLLENHIRMSDNEKEEISKELIEQNGNSPLLQTRFLRNGFEADFEDLVGKILYREATETSHILEEIGQLCIPNRGKFGIRAIVNYNFDDLVEKNLNRLRVKYHSIYGEGMIPDIGELGIYHVHGFLPQDKEGYDKLAKSLLVFSEEGYHKLMLDPYNWANITQLNFLLNNTCVFVGLSMTDPNLRRLLEISAQKRDDGEERCKHYAILRKQTFKKDKKSNVMSRFQIVNESLQENFYADLGVNVIWIDDYKEIPVILKKIKAYSGNSML